MNPMSCGICGASHFFGKLAHMQAYRASILRFDDDGAAVFDKDGLLVVGSDGHRDATGAGGRAIRMTWRAPIRQLPVEHLPGRIIAPGFVDLHVHYPQIDVIGSPASGLLPWLENYTFPQESRFAGPGAQCRGRRASSSPNCCATASRPR